MNKIKIGIVQPRILADINENFDKLEKSIRELSGQGADLVVLPELPNGPYFCQAEDVKNFDMAESIPGPSTQRLGCIAKDCHVIIITTIFERRMAGLCYNTAVVIDRDGTIAGKYSKMHIPDDPGYYEKFYFAPGDGGFLPIKTSAAKLGVQVCYDQWFPEGARLMAIRGAQILIYPTAIGYTTDDSDDEISRQREAWITVQRGHAIANNLHVVAVNRTGYEPDPSGATKGINFWGSSFVCGPQGEILAQAPTSEEAEMVVEIDLDRTEQVRRWWPYLRDRRIDQFGDLTSRCANGEE